MILVGMLVEVQVMLVVQDKIHKVVEVMGLQIQMAMQVIKILAAVAAAPMLHNLLAAQEAKVL